jgi:hypothetical protein
MVICVGLNYPSSHYLEKFQIAQNIVLSCRIINWSLNQLADDEVGKSFKDDVSFFFFHRIIDDIIIIRTSMDLQVKIVIYYLCLVQIKLILKKNYIKTLLF